MRWLALHGVPAGPRTFERIELDMARHAFHGLAPDDTDRQSWSLDSFVDEVLPLVDRDTALVGHDLGGVVAAMVACRTQVAGVVLSGTALGSWWALTRATAIWPFERYFYRRHGGRKFLLGGIEPSLRPLFGAEFEDVLDNPHLPERMRRLATEMRPPAGLARRLSTATKVGLVWGRSDAWYPKPVAQAVARSTRAPVEWVDGGHYCMWSNPDAYARALRAPKARWLGNSER
jgi:pimeloyl-ACP methyl ester carboxylesterase